MSRIRIADFYGLHQKRVIWLTIGLQVMVTSALAFLLLNSGFNPFVMIIFVILPVVILQVFAFIVVLKYALGPLDILSRAIAHVSNETNDVTPPNINGTYHERTGLKPMVETIYNLTLNGPKSTDDVSSGPEATILEHVPVGVVALDEKRNIIYANKFAPVTTDNNGKQSLQLMFDTEDKLDKWLTQSEANSVSDTHAWTRVQT